MVTGPAFPARIVAVIVACFSPAEAVAVGDREGMPEAVTSSKSSSDKVEIGRRSREGYGEVDKNEEDFRGMLDKLDLAAVLDLKKLAAKGIE